MAISRVVTLLVGVVLLFASGMKGLALSESTISPGKIDTDWWISLAASGFELVLGVWLVVGVFPIIARIITGLTFVGFAGVALYKVMIGEATCGCLGNLQLHPSYSLAFDVAVLAALWRAKAPTAPAGRRLEGLVLLAGVLVLTTGLGLKVYASATDLSRGLQVRGARVYEFGEVGQNEILSHTFVVENRTPYPVEVVQTTSSCGCTTSRGVGGQRIESGGALDIPVALNTGESEEHLTGTITLFCRKAGSEAPPGLFQKVQVAAKVLPDYWVRPLVLDLGAIDRDLPVTRLIRLRPNRMPDVRIIRVETSHPAFTARLLDDQTTEGDIQVEVTFSGRALTTSGPVGAVVTLHTNSTRRPMVGVSLMAHFRAPVTVDHQAVVVGTNVHGEVVQTVLIDGVRPIRVEAVRADSPLLLATAIRETPTRWRVGVTLPEQTQVAGLNATLTFDVRFPDATDAGEARRVAIPVHRLAHIPSGGTP